MFTRYISIVVILMASFTVHASDDFTFYAVGDFMDIHEYFEAFRIDSEAGGTVREDEILYYQDMLNAGFGRRLPITTQIILKTDSRGELSQYIVYLAQSADEPHFNCTKITNVFNNYFLPRKPPFYINNCEADSISFYRSSVY